MKIGFFDPYLDSLGGGERYTLTLAEYFCRNHQVDIFWDGLDLKDKIRNQLSIDLEKARFVKNIFSEKNLFKKIIETRKYDFIFYLSDGSFPFSIAGKNILHFQFPFSNFDGKYLLNRVRLKCFSNIVVNSFFTKKFIDKTYGVDSKVIYPPVDIRAFQEGNKKNIILTVGRFSKNKKQEIMINSFINLVNRGLKDWEFHLVGGLLDSDALFFRKLETMAKSYPIKMVANSSFRQIRELYSEAKIYWHAAGFGEDVTRNPEFFEHFGISCVEAMASGAVPIVFNGGGLREIITNESGILWNNELELQEFTESLINDEKKILKLREEGKKRSLEFSKEIFLKKFDEIITF